MKLPPHMRSQVQLGNEKQICGHSRLNDSPFYRKLNLFDSRFFLPLPCPLIRCKPPGAIVVNFMSEPQTVRGFITGRMPFGNTSLIVRCLSREAGRLTFMAKGALRPKTPFAGMIDLFYLADFLYQPARTGEIHTLREVKLIEPHIGLRRSYANLLAAQYFANLIETVTEPGTPVPGEFELFAKALGYLCTTDISWRAVDRFEQRILALAGVAHADHDLPRALQALHHHVPTLRHDLLKLLAAATKAPSS